MAKAKIMKLINFKKKVYVINLVNVVKLVLQLKIIDVNA